MELGKCIHNRRSIRKYLDKKVEKEKLLKIVEAARWAPSGGNYQRWKFIVITDKKTINKLKGILINVCQRDRLNTKNRFRIFKYGTFFNAPVIISVCVDLTEPLKNKLSVVDKMTDATEVISAGAAIENMLLKIYELGLGGCWCRVDYFKRKQLEKCLKITNPFSLIANITVGYPAQKPNIPSRKKIKEITEWIE